MAIDFPSSPADGDIYQGYIWDDAKNAWRSRQVNSSAVITSPTTPTGATAGDLWFNSNDGTLYVYYNDGITSQWIENRSEIATSKIGLVPVIPTSVSISAGTASVNSVGKISMSGVSNITINGAFSSSFRNYMIFFNYSYGTGAAWTSFRWRGSGTDNSSAIYDSQYQYQGTYSAPSLVKFSNETSGRWFPEGGYKTTWAMSLYSPAETLYTVAMNTGGYVNTDNSVEFGTMHSLHKTNTSYDGFTFFSSAGKNGTIQIFGVTE